MSKDIVRVLLVEDSPSDARLLCESLQDYPLQRFEIERAERLSEAVDFLRQKSFDVVLLDLSLPDSRGLETCARLSQAAGQMPIIVLTGADDETTAAEVMRFGVQDYLVKGQTPGSMIGRTVRYAVERSQSQHALREVNERLQQQAEELQTQTEELTTTNEELRESEQALHKAEERLHLAMESGKVGVWEWEPGTEQVEWSQGFYRLLGYEPDEVAPSQKAFRQRIHPQDRARQEQALRESLDRCEDYFCEFRVVWADGSVHWVEARGQYVFAGDKNGAALRMRGVLSDIDRRKQAEEALRKEKAISESTIESLPGVFYLFDSQGRYLKWNKGLEQVSGYTAEEIERMHPLDFFVGEDKKLIEQRIQEVFTRGQSSAEAELVTKDGHKVPFFFTGLATTIGDVDCLIGMGIDITARKEAEEELHWSERRFRSTFENAAIGIAHVTLNGRILLVNSRFCAIAGYACGDVVGKTCEEITFADDWKAEKDLMQRLLDGRLEHYAIEKRYVRTDGSLVWVNLTRSLQRDDEGQPEHFIVLVEDISQRKQVEEALHEANEQLQKQTRELQTRTDMLGIVNTALQQSQDALRRSHDELEERVRERTAELLKANEQLGLEVAERERAQEATRQERQRLYDVLELLPAYVILLTPDHRVPFANRFFRERFGDSCGQRCFEYLFGRTEPCDVCDTYKVFETHAPLNWEWTGPDGRIYDISDFPFTDADGSPLIMEMGIDITERKQAEKATRQANEALAHRARQLQKLTLELSEAEERERRRLAEILHDDLQQVLAAAKFHLGLMKNRAKYDPTVQAAATQVDQMLKDAIEKSRGLSHELSPAVLHHGDFAETLGWLARQVQAKHGLQVRVDAFGAVQSQSDTLKAFLYRAAQELLFNVVKHAGVNEARVRVRRLGRYLCLSVSDRGRGFDPQEIRETAGFGLLSIRERVALLGGRMSTHSAQGRGATFHIIMPDGAPCDKGATAEQGPSGRAAPDSRAREEDDGRLRVLLVDDHEVVRQGVASLLSEEPAIRIVGEAANGREAVDLANRLRPDVVVMDVSMPIMSGDEATRQIKKELPRTRVVALSMHEQGEVVETMRRAGAERYVLKTAPAEELIAAIRGRQAHD